MSAEVYPWSPHLVIDETVIEAARAALPDADAALGLLRQAGVSQGESMQVYHHLAQVSASEAKAAVVHSPVWAGQRPTVEGLHAAAMVAAAIVPELPQEDAR